MPIQRREKQALIYVVSILIILAIDQYSKFIVSARLSVGQSIPIIKNILHITFVTNTGAAFGLFKDSTLFFIIISVVVVGFVSILLLISLKKRDFLSKPAFNSSLILILSGALGNLIDRLRFTYVVDFIDVRIWPVFNIADISITIGTFLLILIFLFPHRAPGAIDRARTV